MHRLRIYIDTSVLGGIHDDEFGEASRRFLDWVMANRCTLLLSSATYAELEPSPPQVRQVLAEIPPGLIENVAVDEEVDALAQAYIESGVIGESNRVDAVHVASASVRKADLIVSWNFKHIVNLDRIRKYNAVNLLKGYGTVEIRSPLEISYGDEA